MTLRRVLAVAALVAATETLAAAQSIQRAPVNPAATSWRVVEPSAGLLRAADGRLGSAVAVRFDLLRLAAANGGTIELPLPNGLVVRAAIEWVSLPDPSHIFVAGSLLDGLRGEISLTVVGDALSGRIAVNDQVFVVRRAPDSALHVVTEVDPQQFPPDREPLIPGAGSPRPQADNSPLQPEGAVEADTNDFVDLLVLYTPAARGNFSSASAIEAEITASVNNANVALTNSGVKHRLRLVHSEEVSYTEASPADADTDLNRLTNTSDGIMDNAHTLRDTFKADIVSLIVNTDPCGLGWIMQSNNVNAAFQIYGFNVVHWSCMNGNLSLAHEIGHNMGLAHDRPNASVAGAFSYAYGYSVPGVGRDVMATGSCTPGCPRLAIFSTPLKNFPSSTTPAGTATEDNARALDNTSPTVANFRQSIVCTYSLAASTAFIGPAGSQATVGVIATGSNCTAWTAVSNAAFITITGGASGTGNGTVTYSVSALASGTRTGTLTIAGLTFTVTQGPTMTLDRTTLSFGAVNTGGTLSNVTASQTARVTFAGASPTWIANGTPSTPAWLQITGGAGTGNGQFTVAVTGAPGLPASGTLTATIQVVSGGAVNSPQLITVRFSLFAATTTTAAPVGSFDTPAPGTVQGSVAVTGWALDDIEVARVEIWRDLAAGETTPPFNGPGHPGNGKIFIANALFVPGARPDVEAAFPTTPLAYRAGWGYLLLTWGLWNQGTGNFTLYAFAFDKEGKTTTLGSKAITSTNNVATKPFGSVDTPTYGETVTTNFWNFGWALTPNPNSADMRSCTITNGNVSVAIDSGPLIPVTYGGARTDIAGAFPGFSNGSNAGGAYFLDLAPIANGTHSIGWFIVDSCGRSEGVGSRFFTVAKSSLVAADVGRTLLGPPDAFQARLDRAASLQADPIGSALHVIELAQGERLELPLPATVGIYSGVQIVNGERRALPVGSSLDKEKGIFYWQPAAGFLGAFDLEFVPNVGRTLLGPPSDGGPQRPALHVRIIVGPPMRMAIDTPQSGSNVDQPFWIAGWALDLAATDGSSGIDTVHVWAYPANGRKPIFLGVATIGDSRPDVATTYGAQFEGSSYSLLAAGLTPGTYDVVVYPHRALTQSFDAAQLVRVTVQ